MIWVLVVILLIIVISLSSKSKKKTKLEIKKLEKEMEVSNEPKSVSDELIKLKNLLDDEVIDQAEFDIQKKKLLNN